jgi:hypothetical protein
MLSAMEAISRCSLSAPGGGEGWGEVGEGGRAAHLTLPVAEATGPLPVPPKSGGEGELARRSCETDNVYMPKRLRRGDGMEREERP